MKPIRLLAIAVILFGFPGPRSLTAQTQLSKISGTVTDPTGASVVSANISALALDTKAQAAQTKSDPEGRYSLELPPGRYRVSVQYTSFSLAEKDVSLAAGENRAWDVRLQLEKTSSHVVVTTAAEPLLAETSPDRVDVITREQIEQRQEIWLTDALVAQQGASFARLGPSGGITSFSWTAEIPTTRKCWSTERR